MKEFLRKLTYICAAHEHCSGCPISWQMGGMTACYAIRVILDDLKGDKLDELERAVSEEYARLKGLEEGMENDTQDNNIPR